MPDADPNDPVAVSACLLGIPCRYDGTHKLNSELLARIGSREILPVCPEELGGLPTPRPACAILGGDGADVLAGRARVQTEAREDRTEAFLRGARRTLDRLRARGVRVFLAKACSPSCGSGSHAVFGRVRRGDGVTTALLKQHGIEVHEV